MFNLSVPWWELMLRGVVVYAVLLALLRITGRRQMSQMSAFDLVLLLILSNAVQNSMNAGDNSLVGGLILAATLVILNVAVGWAVFKSRRVETLVEGRPEVIVHNGRIYTDVLKRELVTLEDVHAAVRKAGCGSIDQVRYAILESNGEITVHCKRS